MKTFIKIVLVIFGLIAGVAWLLYTPQVFEYANSQRMYPGYGSEVFYPMVPFVVGLYIWLKARKKYKEMYVER